LAICLALLEIGMTPERAHETQIGLAKFAEGSETTECILDEKRALLVYQIRCSNRPKSSSISKMCFLARSDHISLPSDLDLSDHSAMKEMLSEVRFFSIFEMRPWAEFLLTRMWFAMAELGLDVSDWKKR
jgi:hypothetical protein